VVTRTLAMRLSVEQNHRVARVSEELSSTDHLEAARPDGVRKDDRSATGRTPADPSAYGATGATRKTARLRVERKWRRADVAHRGRGKSGTNYQECDCARQRCGARAEQNNPSHAHCVTLCCLTDIVFSGRGHLPPGR
jgi:hypothetical protein